MQSCRSSRPIAVSPSTNLKSLRLSGIFPRGFFAREVCITENKLRLLLAYITSRYVPSFLLRILLTLFFFSFFKCASQLANANKIHKLTTSVQTISCCHVASTSRVYIFCREIDLNLYGAEIDRYKLLSTKECVLQRSMLKRKILSWFLSQNQVEFKLTCLGNIFYYINIFYNTRHVREIIQIVVETIYLSPMFILIFKKRLK